MRNRCQDVRTLEISKSSLQRENYFSFTTKGLGEFTQKFHKKGEKMKTEIRPPEEPTLNERITLRIPAQLKQNLEQLKHLGVNQQAWIRQIVCQELKKLLNNP
jgi:hypothetical protein